MNKISKDETEIIGNFIFKNNELFDDENTKRIKDLIDNYLKYICTDSSGWAALYYDETEKRYWERLHLQGEMQAGGPPSLINISYEDAKMKYNFVP